MCLLIASCNGYSRYCSHVTAVSVNCNALPLYLTAEDCQQTILHTPRHDTTDVQWPCYAVLSLQQAALCVATRLSLCLSVCLSVCRAVRAANSRTKCFRESSKLLTRSLSVTRIYRGPVLKSKKGRGLKVS